MPEEPDLIPLQKAALEFGVDESTLYRHIKAGHLKSWKRPAGILRTYVDRKEVKRLLEPQPVKGAKGGQGKKSR